MALNLRLLCSSFTKEGTGVKEETKTSIWDTLPQGLREAFVFTSSWFRFHRQRVCLPCHTRNLHIKYISLNGCTSAGCM